MKSAANEIFGVFEKYKSGKSTYDKALEDASKIMIRCADERPIVGYVRSGIIKKILLKFIQAKVEDKNNPRMFECRIHKDDIEDAERIIESMKTSNT